MIRLVIGLFLLWASPALADDLGCYEPGATVSRATVQFPGTATSVSAIVLDPNDTATDVALTIAAVGGSATDLWRVSDFTMVSITPGVWTLQYTGTVDGIVRRVTDVFRVQTVCPTSTLTATDNIGINWGDITNPTSTVGLTNTTVGTLTTYTGNTPQTGDSFARLGAPAGASIAADIATRLAAGTTLTELSQSIPSATPTVDQAIMALYMCLFRSEVITTVTTWKCKNDAGTIIFSRTASDDGATFTKGEVGSGP